jgi:hypothetical protein
MSLECSYYTRIHIKYRSIEVPFRAIHIILFRSIGSINIASNIKLVVPRSCMQYTSTVGLFTRHIVAISFNHREVSYD